MEGDWERLPLTLCDHTSTSTLWLYVEGWVTHGGVGMYSTLPVGRIEEGHLRVEQQEGPVLVCEVDGLRGVGCVP